VHAAVLSLFSISFPKKKLTSKLSMLLTAGNAILLLNAGDLREM
jgi:hypothetical protein